MTEKQIKKLSDKELRKALVAAEKVMKAAQKKQQAIDAQVLKAEQAFEALDCEMFERGDPA